MVRRSCQTHVFMRTSYSKGHFLFARWKVLQLENKGFHPANKIWHLKPEAKHFVHKKRKLGSISWHNLGSLEDPVK